MKVEVSQSELLPDPGAELTVVGLYEDGALPAAVAELAGATDAKGAFKKLTLLRADGGGRLLVAGLGEREEADAERLRIAAALAAKEAARLEVGSLAWVLPESGADLGTAEALVTG